MQGLQVSLKLVYFVPERLNICQGNSWQGDPMVTQLLKRILLPGDLRYHYQSPGAGVRSHGFTG